jgi:hypothetical protein
MVGGAHRLCLQRGLAGANDFAQALDFALEILRLRHLGRSHKCSRSHSRAPRDYALASPLHQAPPSSLSSASQPDSLARSLCDRLHKFSDPALRGGARCGLPRIAIVRQSLADVRFSPDSDQAADIPKGPICAKRRHRLAYSITSSAWESSVGGTLRPSALAVLRLIASSNLVGCSTGKSAGFAPFSILST